jgi:hypothetical protein
VSDAIPADLKQFLAEHIESLAQLEALLMMLGEPQRAWTCEELARGLYISGDMCLGIVADLERRGLVVREEHSAGVRYSERDDERTSLLSRLAALYRERRVAVITQIYSNPTSKVQTFADAFRLRRED